VVGVLSPRTERDYRQVVERWTRDGQPDPATWVSEWSSEATRRNARAALIWLHRVNLRRTLDIQWVPPKPMLLSPARGDAPAGPLLHVAERADHQNWRIRLPVPWEIAGQDEAVCLVEGARGLVAVRNLVGSFARRNS
jgi:hypothetical protein